jgi:hypothetical protein
MFLGIGAYVFRSSLLIHVFQIYELRDALFRYSDR